VVPALTQRLGHHVRDAVRPPHHLLSSPGLSSS
jgi:hypothetical protein